MIARSWFWIAGVGVATMLTGCSAATQSPEVTSLVKNRYSVSRVDFDQSGRRAVVARQGAVLILQVDGVPANALRVVHPPRASKEVTPVRAQHVGNYAEVAISEDGVASASRGEFTLPRGTRLVVLERKVERDRVRLFTHTLEPAHKADGTTAYGCTEFIVPVEPGLDRAALERRIDRVLLPGA